MAEDETGERSPASRNDQSFADRLRAAEVRAKVGQEAGQGLQGRAGDSSHLAGADARALGFVFRLGTEMVSALVVGVAVGYGLDRWLGHRPLFLIVFSLLGGVAGVMNVWRVAQKSGPK